MFANNSGCSSKKDCWNNPNKDCIVVMCASTDRLTWVPSMICLVVTGPYKPASVHAESNPPLSMFAPIVRSTAITMCSSPGRRIQLSLQSALLISNCFAGLYKPMSSEITVFLSGPTTSALMCCACLRIVNSVRHSCAGAATLVNGRFTCTSELYADHLGIWSGWFVV
jgi:hypothetical protein